jgi:hypothetical protein
MALRTSAHRTSLHTGFSWSVGAALPPVHQTQMKRESLSGSPAAAFTTRAAASFLLRFSPHNRLPINNRVPQHPLIPAIQVPVQRVEVKCHYMSLSHR